MPSSVTAGTSEVSSASEATTGSSRDELGRIAADEHAHRAEPRRPGALDQLQPPAQVVGHHGRGTVSERRGDRALAAGLGRDQLQDEPLALFGQRTCGRRQALALGE